jgi:uroporphyrinogen decarboxylase
MGVDIIHGVEEQPGVDLSRLKSAFGSRICFWGAIDPATGLSGTMDNVTDYTRKIIETLGPGGGYVLSPSNHLGANIPARNVIELFRSASRFGKYPLK